MDNDDIETSQYSSSIYNTPTKKGNISNNIYVLATTFAINQLLWFLLRCCRCKDFLILLQENKQIIELLLIDIILNKNELIDLSPIIKILSIKILMWLLPIMDP